MTAITLPLNVHSSTQVNGQLFPINSGHTVVVALACQSNKITAEIVCPLCCLTM